MFQDIQVGQSYSRPQLARLWGYASFHAIARGVVTPRDKNMIILFVTDEKQSSQEQYENSLIKGVLNWEGPTDHFSERRMISAEENGDEIHLFYRERHHSDFTYMGQLSILSFELNADRPSAFVFKVK